MLYFRPSIRAVIFDFVNTLVPLREQEFLRILQVAYDWVHSHIPHVPFDTFVQHYVQIRDEQYARNLPHLRENDFYERMATLWHRLTGHPPNPKTVYGMMQRYTKAFSDVVEPAPYLPSLLHALSEQYLLGVLSNYPYTPCVYRVLTRHRVSRYFAVIRVSAETGIVKPHPDLFKITLYQLGVSSEQAVFVGDDWCADVVGASRIGMRSIYTHEWRVDPAPCENLEGATPVAQISSLIELPGILRDL